MVFNIKALQSSLQEQQSGLTYLSTTVKEMTKKAPSEIGQKYLSEFEEIEARWKKLSSQLVDHCQKLEEQMSKLRKIEVISDSNPYVQFHFLDFPLTIHFFNLKVNPSLISSLSKSVIKSEDFFS